MIYRLTLSYRGGAYSGWQRQNNATTVHEVVERAIGELLRRQTPVIGCSRTDTGVHARGQVAHIELAQPFSLRALVHGTNHFLPGDVRVLHAALMSNGFHSRRCAESKEYRYRLRRERVLSPLDSLFAVPLDPRVDIEALRRAAGHAVGRHDFSSFAKQGGSHTRPERTLFALELEERGAQIELIFHGDGFLRGMVRLLVGTLLEVGRGRLEEADFVRLLAGDGARPRGPAAPAHGLTLERIVYPHQWQPLEEEGATTLEREGSEL